MRFAQKRQKLTFLYQENKPHREAVLFQCSRQPQFITKGPTRCFVVSNDILFNICGAPLCETHCKDNEIFVIACFKEYFFEAVATCLYQNKSGKTVFYYKLSWMLKSKERGKVGP